MTLNTELLFGKNPAGGYQIERSIRLNAPDSAYLSCTPSVAGNRKTWTWAGWVKRSVLGAAYKMIFSAGVAATECSLRFTNSPADALELYQYSGGGFNWQLVTTQVFRDPSSWYHIVAAVDSTQATSSDRAKLYVNGVQVTAFGTASYPTFNYDSLVNSTTEHGIGRVSASQYFDGYLADVHFIDGQALDPTSFGEFDANGVWQPKAYTGTYPGNSFHLPFSDNSTAAALGTDASGNGNDWTVNNIQATSAYSVTVNQNSGTADLVSAPNSNNATFSNIFNGSASQGYYTGSTTNFDVTVNLTTPITYSSTTITIFHATLNAIDVITTGGTVTATTGGSSTGAFSYNILPPGKAITGFRFYTLGSNTNDNVGYISVDGALLNLFGLPQGIDSLVDTPTNYGVDDGLGGSVRGNYATGNPLFSVGASLRSLANGNLDWTYTSGTQTAIIPATVFPASGKWYAEFAFTSFATGGRIGIVNRNCTDVYVGQTTNGVGYENTGQVRYNGVLTSYGASWAANDLIGVALDLDNGTVSFYKNGASQGVARSGLTGSWTFGVDAFSGTCIANFGQRPFAYPAPSGFKALCTTNLPAPVVAKPSEVMDVKLYTGNGSTQTISGLGFSPDLVWIKGRSTTHRNELHDSVRGASPRLFSDGTDAESSVNTLTAYTSDGFTVAIGSGGQVGTNNSGDPYVAWTWDAGSSTVTNNDGSITSQVRANPSAGFSVVTVNSTAIGTIGHGLGVKPAMIIEKCRSATSNWYVRHQSLGDMKSSYLRLNSTSAASIPGDTTAWNNTEPTSTTISVNNNYLYTNGSVVYYCFAPVAGYSAFGSYTGNGSGDGPFVYTGFRPRWVLVKSTSTTGWTILDAARNTYNLANSQLFPHASDAELTSPDYFTADFLSNGFKLRTTNSASNTNSQTYIYCAFAESPLQYARAR